MKIAIINGPNLICLVSAKQIFMAIKSFENYLEELKKIFPAINFHYYQSNVEGELINEIQRTRF